MSFRFESLSIYTNTLKISSDIFTITGNLHKNKQYVLADQLFRACLSISNNIVEGSGSNSDKDFAHFLNISRRSIFECANIIIILSILGIISNEEKDNLNAQLETLSRKIQSLRKTLLQS